jgi:hypothetical protein
MQWTLEFGEPCGAALVRTSGVFTAVDHGKMVVDIVSHPDWYPGHHILFDHRELSFDGTGYAEILQVRDNHAKHEARIGNARSAILMKSAADYGFGRQFEMLFEGHVSAQVQIFTDEEAATRWLCDAPAG